MTSFRIRRYLPRSLLLRSLLIIATPVLVLQLLVAFIFLDQHWEAVTNRLAGAVASEIALTIDFMDREEAADFSGLFKEVQAKTDLNFTLHPDGHIGPVDPARQSVLSRMIGSAIKKSLPYPARVQEGHREKTYDVDVMTPYGLLHVVVPQRRVFTVSTYTFIIWFSLAAIVLLTVAILFMRNQVRPIRRLAEAAEHFGRGVDKPFKPEGAREVRRAAAAFLLMRERIKRQITQRMEMLAGVSHDLRTPLTRMKLQLAMMKAAGTDELQSDITEMEQMIEAYLAFARGEGEEDVAETSLSDFINQIIDDARRSTDKTITLAAFRDITLALRPQAIRRALNNILSNAIKYAKDKIAISVAQQDEIIVITIDDDGPGIPPEAREDVFRPFYRLEQSRNRATGGVGLGLAIARDIVRAHGGDILLDTSPTDGLRTQITLPL